MKNEKIYLVIREYSESYEYGTSITAFSTKDKAVEEFQQLIAEEVKHGLGRYYCEDKETLTHYAEGRCVGLWYDDGESWRLSEPDGETIEIRIEEKVVN